jgi:hypothetical protein
MVGSMADTKYRPLFERRAKSIYGSIEKSKFVLYSLHAATELNAVKFLNHYAGCVFGDSLSCFALTVHLCLFCTCIRKKHLLGNKIYFVSLASSVKDVWSVC